MILVSTGFLVVGGAVASWTKPLAAEKSPDGRYELRVFSAGQGSIPPDYRAGVRFWLRDTSALPFFRDTLVAEAALADGWSIRWQGLREVTIETGRLSWFESTIQLARDVRVQISVVHRSAAEAACIARSFAHAIDGVTCFDKLLGAAEKQGMSTP